MDYVSVETHTICNKIQIFSKCVLSGYLNSSSSSMQYILIKNKFSSLFLSLLIVSNKQKKIMQFGINMQCIVFMKKKIFFFFKSKIIILIIITGLTGVLEEMFP